MKFITLIKRKKVVNIFLVILSISLALIVGLTIYFLVGKNNNDKKSIPFIEEKQSFKIIDSNSPVNVDFSKRLPLDNDLFTSKYLSLVEVSYVLQFPNKEQTSHNFYTKIDSKNTNGNFQGKYSKKINNIKNTDYVYSLDFIITSKSTNSNLYYYKFEINGLPKDYKIQDIEVTSSESYLFDKILEWVDVTPRVTKVNDVLRKESESSSNIDLTPSDFNSNKYDSLKGYSLVFKYKDYVISTITTTREARIKLEDYISPIYPKDTNDEIDYTKDPEGVKYKSGVSDTPFEDYNSFKAKKTMELSEEKSDLNDKEFVIQSIWNVKVRIVFSDLTKDDVTKNFFSTGFIIEKIEYKKLSLKSVNFDEIELSIIKV